MQSYIDPFRTHLIARQGLLFSLLPVTKPNVVSKVTSLCRTGLPDGAFFGQPD